MEIDPTSSEVRNLPQEVTYHSWWLKDGVTTDHVLDKIPDFMGNGLNLIDPNLRNPLERLDVIVKGNNPKAGFMFVIHGDEDTTRLLEVVDNSGSDCVIFVCLNPPAAAINSRGNVRQLEKGERRPKHATTRMINSRRVGSYEKGGYIGVIEDLNRMFKISEFSSWEDIESNFPDNDEKYNQARIILAAVKSVPFVEYWFSIHGNTRPFHLYDTPFSTESDLKGEDHTLILDSIQVLRSVFRSDNFRLASGSADPDDPSVDGVIDDGYIYDPVFHKHDKSKPSGATLDELLVRMGEAGLIQAKRVVTIEMPINKYRETKEDKITSHVFNFISSFLTKKGIWRFK